MIFVAAVCVKLKRSKTCDVVQTCSLAREVRMLPNCHLFLVSLCAKPTTCRDNDAVRTWAAQTVCSVCSCFSRPSPGVFSQVFVHQAVCLVTFWVSHDGVLWAACTVWVFDGMCEEFPECVFLVWYANVCVHMCVFYGGPVQAGRFEGGQTAAFYCPRG